LPKTATKKTGLSALKKPQQLKLATVEAFKPCAYGQDVLYSVHGHYGNDLTSQTFAWLNIGIKWVDNTAFTMLLAGSAGSLSAKRPSTFSSKPLAAIIQVLTSITQQRLPFNGFKGQPRVKSKT